jgi:hypothetical protein
MKKLFIIIVFLLFSSSLFAEFILEPVICTTKKTSNCGAYIYNTKTGEVYFCDSEECKEVKTPIEIFIEEEEESGSLIPKKPKKKESKIPKKPKKKESKIPKKPKKEDSKSNKCKDSKIPKKGCT